MQPNNTRRIFGRKGSVLAVYQADFPVEQMARAGL
jgi:hypothetical protein